MVNVILMFQDLYIVSRQFIYTIFLFAILFVTDAKAYIADPASFIIPQQQKFFESEMLNKELSEFEDWQEKREQDDKKEQKINDEALPSENKDCFIANFIEFEGNTVLSKKALNRIVEKYRYKCLTADDIREITKNVILLYYEKSYITTQLYVKEQNLYSHVLTFAILEGKIEDVIVKDNKINSSILFAGSKGKVLNMRDVDQTTDNLLAIQSYQYKVNIAPGTKPGFSIINITGKDKLHFKPSMDLDNFGQYTTGHERYSIGTQIDNLLGLGDSLNFKYFSTIGWEYGDRYSKSFITSWSMPVKYATFGFNFSYAEYLSTVNTRNQSFQYNGTMINGSLFWRAVLLRRKNIKTTWFLQYNIMDLKNYGVGGIFQPQQSRTLTNVEMGINNNFYTKYGSFFHRISYTRGLGTIGSDISGYGMFDSFRFYQVYTVKFKDIILPFIYQNTIDAQYALSDLYPQNQFVLGGYYSIRGFRDSNIYSSSGILMKNDIDFALADYIKSDNKWLNYLTNRGKGGLVLGAFFDIGIAGSYTQNTTASGTGAGTLSSANYGYLAGTGFKIRYDSEHFQCSFVFAKSVLFPDYLAGSVNNMDNIMVYTSIRIVV